MDGTFRLVVRVVSSIRDVTALGRNCTEAEDADYEQDQSPTTTDNMHDNDKINANNREQDFHIDVENYRPDIKDGIWNVSETDIELLIAGTGVLGVGCIGESTNQLLSLRACLRDGRKIRVVSCSSVDADEVICAPLYMVSTRFNLSSLFVNFDMNRTFCIITSTPAQANKLRGRHRCLWNGSQAEMSKSAPCCLHCNFQACHGILVNVSKWILMIFIGQRKQCMLHWTAQAYLISPILCQQKSAASMRSKLYSRAHYSIRQFWMRILWDELTPMCI